MGNVIRLGIARIGLALNSFWTTTKRKAGRKPPIVFLILGAQEVGKSTIASRLSFYGKSEQSESTYVPTKGFNIFEVKYNGTTMRLYDLGGSNSVRDLWTHYYPDAHGIIYIVDTSGKSSSISEQSQILYQVLQDERVKRKPLLVLGNKQDIETIETERLVVEMNLIQVVNTAKCLTRVDMTSKVKVEGFEDGLMVGFRWLIAYVKWHWGELNERVENDSMMEKSRENIKFEALHTKHLSPTLTKINPKERSEVIGSSSAKSRSYQQDKKILEVKRDRRCQSAMSTNQNQGTVLNVLPQKRLDPEGGNDEKEWKPDTSNVIIQNDFEDEFPEVVIVESRAEVHAHRPSSASAVTLNSSVMSEEAILTFDTSESTGNIDIQETKVPNGLTSMVKKLDQSRPKLFRNKTAPMREEPIRMAIVEDIGQEVKLRAHSISATTVLPNVNHFLH